MPRIRFLRTPTEAEGGPGHPFREGTAHDVAPRSARRWLEMEAAVLAPIDDDVETTEIFSAAGEKVAQFNKLKTPVPIGEFEAAMDARLDPPAPTQSVAIEGDAASGGALVAVEAGGCAPPILVELPTAEEQPKAEERANAGREMRPAGRGLWHVFQGAEQLSRQPLRRIDAEALVEYGPDAPRNAAAALGA
jgi:hypothetical protein